MKQIVLFIAIIIISVRIGQSQNLQLISEDSGQELESNISLAGDTENMMVLEFVIKNNDSRDITARMERVDQDVVDGSINSICVTGTCLMPQVDLSPEFVVPADGELGGFYVEYNPNGNPGLSTIDYNVFNVDDNSDSVSFTVIYDATTSVEDALRGLIVSDIYPNPTSSVASLDYDLKPGAELVVTVYDMLGKRVLDYKRSGSGSLSIPADQLEKGTYFYRYSIDGEVMDTQKLIVK
ncbi:MAG: T9SS type A sorting domain-containing protein [Bacteroidales bacterium]